MNLEKIILKNPQLSIKAIGLISYISIHDPYLEETDKQSLTISLKEGKDAIKKAFNELLNADIIELSDIKNNGKFIYKYKLNEFYL